MTLTEWASTVGTARGESRTLKKTSDKNEKSRLWHDNTLNQTEWERILVPLSSSGLLARLRVVRPELGLWARAAANFWAKSLQSVKDCFHYTCPATVMHVCVCVCLYLSLREKALWKYADCYKYTPKWKLGHFLDSVLITWFALKTLWYPHVLRPALSRTNSSSRPERDTTRRICSHTSADWGHTHTRHISPKNFPKVGYNKRH